MVRVLKVIPGVTPDAGTERSLVSLVPGLLERGVRLHLAVLTGRQTLVPQLEELGVVVHDLSCAHGLTDGVDRVGGAPIGRRPLWARARSIRNVVQAVSPDLVHASLFEATLPTQLALRGTDVPLLVTWANTNYGPARTQEPGVHPRKVAAVQRVEATMGRLTRTRYHAVTDAVGRINAAELGVPATDVFVAERGRDPERFSPEHVGRVPLRDLPIDPTQHAGAIVLAVGRQEPQKGYERLVAQFDRVVDRRPDAVLLIAGREGSSTASLREAIAAMRHPGSVHLLGQRGDVPDLLALADVVVCSSWREGAAGALIEAMAVGTPIASVQVAGLDGVLVDGENAVVRPPHELADAVLSVLDDPATAARLAEEARHTFDQRFTIDAAADRMVQVYQAVLDQAAHDRRVHTTA